MSDGSKLVEAAALAAGGQEYPAAALYVVATPIGNLADITFRALHVLAIADCIACEDTRHSGALLRHYGLDKTLLAAHAHNEHAAAAQVVERLGRGERVACISDAGTPGLSDPGAVLVAAAQAAGFRVVPIPGPSSALAALAVAGDSLGSGFGFEGFVDARGGGREQALAAAAQASDTRILFEAPHRIVALAASLAALCPERTVTLCRELTKQFETVATMLARALPAWLDADANRRRGEFVLVLHAVPTVAGEGGDARHDALLVPLLEALPLKQAVALAVRIGGAPRNELYARALSLKA